jgi:hypothetical protein
MLILISPGHFSGKPEEKVLFDLTLFLWGLSGVPIIIRKEIPGFIIVRGWSAVVTGIFITAACWTILIVDIVSKLHGRP